MASIRCKLTGCDLDPCGVCKRCGDTSAAAHDWTDVERERPCFKQQQCTRCGETKEMPDHDWVPTPMDSPDGTGVELRCGRCGLKI
jgi:ribosomal protein S27AE